jgi:hypothetical protein
MEDTCKTVSIDNISIEIYESRGEEFVAISRQDSKGSKPGLLFKRGDNAPAVCFLTQIAELLGVQLVVEK